MSNLIQRTLTGILFVLAIIGSILWNPIAFGILFLVVTVIGMLEFYKLISEGNKQPGQIAGILSGVLSYILILLFSLNLLNFSWLFLILPILGMPALIELFRKNNPSVFNFIYSAFATIYIAIPLAMLSLIMNPSLKVPHEYPWLLISFFLLVWVNDIFAYLSGSLMGRHALHKRVSPGKTWEGSIGGLIFSMATAFGLHHFVGVIPLWLWLLIAVVIVVFGTLGDLVESMFKRRKKVKDSGTLLPGHGGILDRFDAIFFSAPMVAAILIIWLT